MRERISILSNGAILIDPQGLFWLVTPSPEQLAKIERAKQRIAESLETADRKLCEAAR